MKPTLTVLVALSLMLAGNGGAHAAPPAAAKLAGTWLGTLAVGGGMSLRLVLRFTPDAHGGLSATLTSPDQSPAPIPADKVTVQGATVDVVVSRIRGSFHGTLAGKRLTGRWTQGGSPLPLTLTKTDKALALHQSPEPQPPFPYHSQDVSFADPAAPGVTLAGTLTLPPGPGPFPAAVLIAGSGPQTRDEDIFRHRIFFVLADSLTRRGVAVLRYDKRGLGRSTGDYAQATTADFAADARAAVAYLQGFPSVDPKRIGLIGHSEGGLIAPMVAADTPSVAFLVLLAGPGLTGEQVLLKQAALIGKAAGASDAQVQRNAALQRRLFAVARANPDAAVAREKMRGVLVAYVAALPPAERKSVGDPQAFAARQSRWASPWFREFLDADPAPALRRVTCPVLALNGSHDLQVPPREDLAAIADALKAGGNRDYTAKELPGLNHLFQTSRTGSPAEYAASPETISPLALQTIGAWVSAHAQPGG